jgi:hypothetical protein
VSGAGRPARGTPALDAVGHFGTVSVGVELGRGGTISSTGTAAPITTVTSTAVRCDREPDLHRRRDVNESSCWAVSRLPRPARNGRSRSEQRHQQPAIVRGERHQPDRRGLSGAVEREPGLVGGGRADRRQRRSTAGPRLRRSQRAVELGVRFPIVSNTCGVVAAGSDTGDIAFRPLAAPRNGSITVASNAPGSPHTVSLSGTGTSVAPTANKVAVVEYNNAGFGHYFMTADTDEITGLDGGAYNFAFLRTQRSFNAGTPDDRHGRSAAATPGVRDELALLHGRRDRVKPAQSYGSRHGVHSVRCKT